MPPAPRFKSLLRWLAKPLCGLLVCLPLSLPAQALPEPYQRSADAWGLDWLDQAAPRLLALSAACDRPADSRFFEVLGGDFVLGLGDGLAPIIGRGTWNAGPVITAGRSWTAYPREGSTCAWMHRITVHHTHGLYTIQSLQQFHQTQADPKADIGYHFFIDSEGRIYEARPLGYMGSHSEADNSNNVGIVLNGDFSEHKPDPRQLASLRSLLKALHCPCAPLDGLWVHQQRKGLRMPGDPAHYTACPGQELATEVYGLAEALGFGPSSSRQESR